MTRRRRKRTLVQVGPSCSSREVSAKKIRTINNNDPSTSNLLKRNVNISSSSPIEITHRPRRNQQQSPRHRQNRSQPLRRGRPRHHACLHCHRLFTFRPFLLHHLRLRHRRIHCKKCCKYFLFRRVYIRHIFRVHGSRLRRKSRSLDSDGDSLASSTSSSGGSAPSSTKSPPNSSSSSPSSSGRLAWLYSPDTFDFVCPHCFYESFNEHDIRTHVASCRWKRHGCQHESTFHASKFGTFATPASNVEASKRADDDVVKIDTFTSATDRECGRPRRPSLEGRRTDDKSPKITKISREMKRERVLFNPSLEMEEDDDDSRHKCPSIPGAFHVDTGVSPDKLDCRVEFGKNDKISDPRASPEVPRTRASDETELDSRRRKSGDLCPVVSFEEESTPVSCGEMTESPVATLTVTATTIIPTLRRASNVPTPITKETQTEKTEQRKSSDLSNIDASRVNLTSPEGMGSFLKDVIDFLADGNDVDGVTGESASSTASPPSIPASPTKTAVAATGTENHHDADVGVTRIRSKRIACQQQKNSKTGNLGTQSPKKIVEFVSLEDDENDVNENVGDKIITFPSASDSEIASVIKLEKDDPLMASFSSSVSSANSSADSISNYNNNNNVGDSSKSNRRRRRSKKLESDIQKMLLAYSCNATGNLIVRPSMFTPSGISLGISSVSPTSISPQNPFSIPLLDAAASTIAVTSPHIPVVDENPDLSQVSPAVKQRRKDKRKRRDTNEADVIFLQMASKIESCSIVDDEAVIDEDVASTASEGAATDVSTERRTLRKRVTSENVGDDTGNELSTKQKQTRDALKQQILTTKGLTNALSAAKKQTVFQASFKSTLPPISSSPCCSTKPLSSSKANRLTKTEVKSNPSAAKEMSNETIHRPRFKNEPGLLLKENDSRVSPQLATTTTDWRWPPKINDMVVGLFEDGWYIGKALEIMAKGDRVKIKFMEDRNFKVTQRFWRWPRVNDIQVLVKCSILNVRPEVKLLDKAKGECTKNLAGGVYEVTNLAQIQAGANEFYKRKRPTAPDVF